MDFRTILQHLGVMLTATPWNWRRPYGNHKDITHQCSLSADPTDCCCSAIPVHLSKENQMGGWCGSSDRFGDLLDRYFLL